HNCPRARDRCLPRLGTTREDKAGRLSAAAMGAAVCLAGEQQAALSAVVTAAAAQRHQLCRGLGRCRHIVPAVYAVSGADLDRPSLQCTAELTRPLPAPTQ